MEADNTKPKRLMRMLFGEQGDVLLEPVTLSMTISSGLLMLGNIVISPLLVDLAGIYQVSPAQIGLIITLYNAPPVILMLFMGVLADRIGRKILLFWGLMVYALSGAALALTSSFEIAILLRVLQGVGFSASTPLITTIIGDVYHGPREATAQGMRVAGNNFMSIASPVFASILIGISWKLPFLLFLSVIPIAFWILATVPDAGGPVLKVPLGDYLKSMFSTVRNLTMVLVNLTIMLRFVVYFGYLTYISFIGKQTLGMTTVAVGVITGTKAVTSFIGSTQTGRLTQRTHNAVVALLAFLLCGAGLLMTGLYPSVATLVIGSILFGIGDGITNPIQKSLITNLAVREVRGGAIAFSTSVGNLGKAMAPGLMAIVLTLFDIPAVFTMLGFVSLFCGWVCLVIRRRMSRV
jgi:MFS transporter, ACDE family, multidrug resistance protein